MTMAGIEAIALDVDGVITDGSVYWGSDGEEWKRFSFADIMGISLALKSGLIVSLMSGESSPLIDRYAEKFGLQDVEKGCKDKASAIRAFAIRHKLDLAHVCFMGDDVNDLEAMRICGFSAAPKTARPAVLKEADFVSERSAGNGAVRDLIDAILAARSPVAE